jgi:hypothetical protein
MAIESNIPYVSVCDGKGKRLGAIEGEKKKERILSSPSRVSN